MATITTTLVSDADFYTASWESLQENGGVKDEGQPVILAGGRGILIGASGNFDTSATITIQGSNDNSNWFSCHTVAGDEAVLSATVASVTLASAPKFLRPIVSANGAGDASDINVFLSCARH